MAASNHSIKYKLTGINCDLLYKENPSNPSSSQYTWNPSPPIAVGDRIGLYFDYDEETFTFSKGGKSVYKGELDYDLMTKDLYVCVAFWNEANLRLVTARKGTYHSTLNKDLIKVQPPWIGPSQGEKAMLGGPDK